MARKSRQPKLLPIPRAIVEDATMLPLFQMLRDTMVTPGEVATRWRYSEDHMSNMRRRCKGPPFIRLPSGGIRYRLSDIITAEFDGMGGPITLERVLLAVTACRSLSAEARGDLIFHLQATLG